MKQLMRAISMSGVALICVTLHGRYDVNTPNPLYTGRVGYVHYDRFEERDENCTGLIFEPWAAGYYRNSMDAYGPKVNCSTPAVSGSSGQTASNCFPGTCCPAITPATCFPVAQARESLAALLFGQDVFTIAQSFANSSAAGSTNPFVTVAHLSPRYTFSEKGVFLGLVIGKSFGCDDQWHAGARIELPYQIKEMKEACGDLVGEEISDVLVVGRQETLKVANQTATNAAWAARLDYLSSLNRIALDVNGAPQRLVTYGSSTTSMQIGGQGVQAGGASPTAIDPLVSAIESVDGSVPSSVRWANTPMSASAGIAADGSGLANLQRGYFVTGNGVYSGSGALASNAARQAQLWIVPNVDGSGVVPPEILGGADTIQTEILQSASASSINVTSFLTSQGLDFCAGNTKGLGDLDVELFLNRQWECGWIELQMGFRFPTGKRIFDPLTPARQAIGNNGHYEFRPGLVFGCQRWDYVRFMADITYSFVAKAREMVAAAFTGATIQNIGPATAANISWGYFTGTFGLTLINPCKPNMGCTLAYEPYVKQYDKINYCYTQAYDWNGNLQTLDASLLMKNTDRVAHKLRTEVFYTEPCCNIYGGFAQVIAGKNIARDTDMYLGIMVNF